MESSSHQSEIDTLRRLLAGIDYCTLTTRAADGALVARPLQVLQVDAAASIWFFTAASSAKVDDVRRDPQVNLAFADPDRKLFVTVSGRSELLVDRGKAAELWRASQTVFFPRGPADPALALLKVQPSSARYWDGHESILGLLLKFGKAVLRREPSDLGASGAIDFTSG